MKVETPQILWNSEEGDNHGLSAALMSVDVLTSGITIDDGNTRTPTYVLATAGNCNSIHLWRLQFINPSAGSNSGAATDEDDNSIFQKKANPNSATKIEFLTALSRHDGPVSNCKFSPDGLHLATSSVTGDIIVWSVPVEKRGNNNGQHYWSTVKSDKQLNTKIADRAGDAVTDLSWSSDSKRFLVSTVDHTILLLEQTGSDSQWRISYRNGSNHSAYVQGVAYDPSDVYFASMSNDRTVRILSRKAPTSKKQKKTILRPRNSAAAGPMPSLEQQAAVSDFLSDSKFEINIKAKQLKYYPRNKNTNNDEDKIKKQYLFTDESTLECFVRRLAWTVDGAYLICPAGLAHQEGAPSYATILYQRHKFDAPAIVLPGLEKPSVAVCPNPVLFELPTKSKSETTAETKENNVSQLPYRSIFAVLTHDSVLIYDTHHDKPLSIITGLHYANLVDATWTSDGHKLIVCSSDGYISMIRFADNELGTVYAPTPSPPALVVAAASAGSTEDASVTTVTPASVVAPAAKLPVQQNAPALPPCERGTATVECPPAKKTRITPTLVSTTDEAAINHHKRPVNETAEAVDKLTLDGSKNNSKKKKRVQLTTL